MPDLTLPGVQDPAQPPQSNDLFKRASGYVDDLFKPIGQPLGQTLGDVTKPLGQDWSNAFRSFGEQAPRLAAEMALTQGRGVLPKALGFGDVALQSMGETADKGLTLPQRVIPAALQTAAFAATPKAAGFGEEAANALAKPVAAKLPTNLGALVQGAARKGGSALGAISTFEAANAASAQVMNQPYDPFTPEHAANVVASVLPFELLGLPHAVNQYKIDQHNLWYDKLTKNIQAEDAAKAPILTNQRESEDVDEGADLSPVQASPVAMEQRPLPPELAENESKLRGPFSLQGPAQVLSEFGGGKINPTQVFGRLQNTLHPDEFKHYEDAGLMQELTTAKTPLEVAKWMQEVGPQIKVTKFGESARSPEQREAAQLRHNWYDNLSQQQQALADGYANNVGYPENQSSLLAQLVATYRGADPVVTRQNLDRYTVLRNVQSADSAAHWSSIAPKPESEMPGYVEGAVVAGTKRGKTIAETLANETRPEFSSSHSFPPNTLGFFRGYMEKRPDGGKTFHVVEVQSDWAQQARSEQQHEGYYGKAQSHPLLKQYERLALKAAIDHARKEGADRIAVSDAETAMMTEGHDRQLATFIDPTPHNIEVAKKYNTPLSREVLASLEKGKPFQSGSNHPFDRPEQHMRSVDAEKAGFQVREGPAQEQGMRLHYDQTLPRTLEELTGQKGERREFGTNKMAGDDESIRAGQQGIQDFHPRQNLIFKNPDGTPKISITAREYPLDRLPDKPFSLYGKDKLASRLSKPLTMEARRELGRLEDFGHDLNDLVDTGERMAAFDRKSGESLIDFMTRSLGLNVDLNKPAKPDELLHNARTLVDNYTRNVLGMDDVRAGYWTDKFLRFVQMLGSTQGETRVLPALPYTKNDQLKASSFYAPSRGDLPNAFIGVFQHTGYSPERSMFEFFHSMGHELFHGAIMQGEGKSFVGDMPPKMVEAAKNLVKLSEDMKLTQGEMQQSIYSTLRMMAGSPYKNLLDYRAKHYTEDPAGRMEYMADLFGLIGMGAASPRKLGAFKVIDDVLKFTNDDVREFARGVFRDVGTLWDFMKDLLRRVFGWKPSSVETVSEIADNMKKLIQSAEQADKSVEAFLRTQQISEARPWAPVSGVDYDRVEQLYTALGAEKVDKDIDLFRKEAATIVVPMNDKDLPREVGLGKRLRWIDYFNPQLWKSMPEWADVTWLGRNFANLTREAAMNMFKQYKDPMTGKYDVDRMVQISRTGTALNKAFNAVTLRQNALSGPDEGQRLSSRTVNEMPEVKALKGDDKVFFDRFLDQTSAAMHEAAIRHVNSFKDEIGKKVAVAFQNLDTRMRWADAQELGKALTTRYVDIDRLQDPQVMQEFQKAQQTLDQYASKDPANAQRIQSVGEIFTNNDQGKPLNPGEVPAITQKFLDYRGKLLGTWEAPKSQGDQWHFTGKPGYTPEVRLGRWTLAWKEKDGRDNLVAFDKKEDFDKRLASLNEANAKGKLDYLKAFDKEDQRDLFRGLRPDMYNTYVEAITALNNRVIEKVKAANPGNEEVLNDLRDELKPARAIASLIESPYMKQRRLIGGRETLNMAQGVIHYINSTAYTIGKRYARSQQRLFLNDPQMVQNPNLRQNAQKYFNEIVDPSERGFGAFKALLSLNYIFFSPSLALVEFTQQLSNHFPALMANGMKASDALAAIKNANVDMAKASLKGKFKDHVYENPEKTAAVKWATENGVIDSGWLQELFNLEEDLPFINARSHLVGDGSIMDRTGLVGKPLYQLFKAGRDAHNLAIRVNTEVAFTTAWDHLKTQVNPATGKKYEGDALLRAAAELTTESMHGGGRATRPLWYLGIGNPNFGATAGGMMYFLQTYVYNTISQMARYSKNAIANSGLSTQERVSAAKAAGAMLGSQLFLAGVMGIPVTSQAMALVEQAFPDSEPRRRVREMFFGLGKWLNSKTHFAAQDEQMGHFVADTAMDGLASQLTPWNMANRFELGGLLGVDPYKGFSWGSVAGPGGSFLENMLLGPAKDYSEGHPIDAAIGLIPNSNVRRLATLAAHGFDVRNKDSRLNQQLTDPNSTGLAHYLTPDVISMALGFTPKKVAEFRELDEMKRRAEAVEALQQRKFHEQLAGMLQNGQVAQVRSALIQRANDVANYDPKEGARRVAELVQQRTEPFDPLREGSRVGGTYNVGQLFSGPSVASTSEVARLRQRQVLTQSLGFPQGLGTSSLREAELVDRLTALHPGMSKLQARAMLEYTLRPPRWLGQAVDEQGNPPTINRWNGE